MSATRVSPSMAEKDLTQLSINTICALSIDAVQQANSDPGIPMALASVVYCLCQRFLRFDPDHPIWPNRDRFVLSAGWERYTGLEGHIIGMKTFGASAPLKELQKTFGFEPNLVVAPAKQLLQRG